MPFGPVLTKPEKRPQIQLRGAYPEGWWVPEERPTAMAVEGSPQMTVREYQQAFQAKLAALIRKEGKSASETIRNLLAPMHQDQFQPEDSPEEMAMALQEALAFPMGAPGESDPATPDAAERAVESQEDLSLSEIISAGMS